MTLPRTEVFLRVDILNMLRGLVFVMTQAEDSEYKRGWLDAIRAVAISFDVGDTCKSDGSYSASS